MGHFIDLEQRENWKFENLVIPYTDMAVSINIDGDPMGGYTARDTMNDFNDLDINCTHMIVNVNGELRMEDILLLFFIKYVLLEFTCILILLPSSLIGSYKKVTPKDGHLIWEAK